MIWYISVLRDNYLNFKGRARRQEYWMFILFNIIAYAILGGISIAIDNFYLIGAYALATLLPMLGVLVRRLHDVGKSGWFILVRFIPLIGSIWLFVVLVTEGEHGLNQYGPDPKGNHYDEFDQIGQEEKY
jgi:uncharacterized membrane protein YhaH (DUF805 family)